MEMKLDQISFGDFLVDTPKSVSKRKAEGKKLIYSPKELAVQGKKFSAVDERLWTEAVFDLQRRERSRDNWIDWFQACAMFSSPVNDL
jgi:hypothetical protein